MDKSICVEIVKVIIQVEIMKKFFQIKKINEEIFIINVFIFTITLITLLLLGISIFFSAGINEAKAYTKSANEQVVLNLTRYIDPIDQTVEVLASDKSVISGYLATTKEQQMIRDKFLQYEKVNPDIKYIYAGFYDGTMLINHWERPQNYDPTIRPWFVEAVNTSPSRTIAKPYKALDEKVWYLSVSKTLIDDDGNITGVLSVDSLLENVFTVLDHGKLYQSQRTFIIGQDGRIRMDSDETRLGKYVETIHNLLNKKSGYIDYKLDGIRYKGYYRLEPKSGWYVLTVIDRKEITTPIFKNALMFCILGVIYIFLVGLFYANLINRRITLPLRNLSNRIRMITEEQVVPLKDQKKVNPEFMEIAQNIVLLTESSLSRKKDELVTIIESSAEGILATDSNKKVLYINSKFTSMFDLPNYIVENLNHAHFIAEIQGKVQAEDAEKLLCHGTARLHMSNGYVYEQSYSPLNSSQEKPGHIWNFRDITDSMNELEKLNELVVRDDLTKLFNRRAFMEKMNQVFQLKDTADILPILLTVDIDYFKSINDQYGHLHGDAVLKTIAELLISVFVMENKIFRIGGEEFAVLFDKITLAEVIKLSEHFRKECEEIRFNKGMVSHGVTVSVGIAQYRSGMDIKAFIHEADVALYDAKKGGRNKVVISEVNVT